jgi:maleate cis-trans isomerase
MPTHKKLGLIVPSLNSVMEYEIQRMAAGTMSLEQQLGKSVITSTTASMWEMLRMVGDTRDVPGAGRLFSQPCITA